MTNSSRLTERGRWEWPRGDTNGSVPYLDLSGTDVKLFQDIYQEVLDFDPRINAVGSIQDDDDVHVGLASCGKSRDLLKVLLQRGRFMASLPASYFLLGFIGKTIGFQSFGKELWPPARWGEATGIRSAEQRWDRFLGITLSGIIWDSALEFDPV